jgi:glycerol-3-phosphate dehydrogenase
MGEGLTANAHREHLIRTGRHGMVSIAGGKLTTHRRIALEVLRRFDDPRLGAVRLDDTALPESEGGLDVVDDDLDPCIAAHLAHVYGRDLVAVLAQRRTHANALERIHPDGPDVWAQAYHAVEHEWATSVDDVVRRRTTLAVRGLASPAIRNAIAGATKATLA